MKKQIIFTALTGLVAVTATANLDLKLSLKTDSVEMGREMPSKAGIALVTPAFQNAIHNESLATSGTNLYTIQHSGRYYLANNQSNNENQ